MTILCVVATCRAYGRHKPGCDLEECHGCLARLAADGAYICVVHRDRIGQDANTAAALYAELELRLAGTDRPGEMVTGTPVRSPAVNEAAVEARTLIRHVLASWCRLISEERGHALPPDTVHAMAIYIDVNADWLAATEYADEVCEELHELAWGRPRRVAYPSGARVIDIGPCPMAGCGGVVKGILRRVDALLPIEVACDGEDPHHWTSDQWRALARAMDRSAA